MCFAVSIDSSANMSPLSKNTQDTAIYFFYKPYSYGSQAAYNPGIVILNGSFGIWQVATEVGDRSFFEFDYIQSARHLWDNVKNPFKTVSEFGTKRFFLTEVIPSSLDVNNQQYWPNYGLHLVGAGMHSRKTEEWFKYNKVPFPRAWSIATMTVYHYLSEMIEYGSSPHLSVDPIADLWIFDPIGIILFLNDDVCRFFAKTLNMAEWSGQPAYNARTGNLENTSQFYTYKYPLTRDRRWSLFARTGLHEMAGFSRMFSGNRTISIAFGAGVENIVKADQNGSGLAQTASWMWSTALFYDKNNSLCGSLVLTGMPQDRLRINLYPGVLKIGAFSPGLFFALSHEAVFGINIKYCPLGIAYSTGKIN